MDTQNPNEGGMPPQAEVEVTPSPQESINNNSNNEHKFPTIAVVGVVVLIAALISVIYWFTPQGWPLNNETSGAFNIPTEGEYVVLFDGGALYSLDLSNAQKTELGIFQNGSEITDATDVAISEDRTQIALAVPRDGGGNDILVFSDFDESEKVSSQSKYLQALSVSNLGAVLFAETGNATSLDSKVYFVSRAVGDAVESLGSADVPFFMDGGGKVVHGTVDGFKIIDFSSGDSLESETPFVPAPWKVDLSSLNNFMSLLASNGAAYVYEVPSTRPFMLKEEYILPLPGTYDSTISPNGDVALLRNINGDVVVTVFRKDSKEALSYLPELSESTLIISWNK